MHFQLHPQLAADCEQVCDLTLSRVLLMRDANWAWCILVPRVADACEWIDLPGDAQQQLWTEVAQVSAVLRAQVRCDKLNIAALGNVVPQLHVHVIARHREDPAWPRPVWGAMPRQDYEAPLLAQRVAALRGALEASA